MSCMPYCDPLELPSILPDISVSELSPPSSGNVLDMMSQDMLFGSNFQSLSNSASTEVTYACQYASTSTAPYTSAGDVFLPTLPLTMAPNTFVKPTNTYVQPSPLTQSAIIKPKPKRANGRATLKSVKPIPIKPETPDPLRQSLFFPIEIKPEDKSSETNDPLRQDLLFPIEIKPEEKPSETKPRKAKKPKKPSKRNSKKKSPSQSHDFDLSCDNPSCSSSGRQNRTQPKGKTVLVPSLSSSFVPVVSNRRSTTATHTITSATDVATSSFVAFDTETIITNTTTSTVTSTTSPNQAGDKKWMIFKTATVTCNSNTNTRNSFTTSTFTSYTITRPKTIASIISPMQSTYSVPTGVLNQPIDSLTHRPMSSPAPDGAHQLIHIQGAPTTTAGEATLPKTRIVGFAPNATIISNNYKPRATCSIRTMQPIHTVTNVHSTSAITSSVASRAFAQTAITLPPGATLYAASKVPFARVTRSRNVAVTTQSQTFAILNGKGSYVCTTVTFSSDLPTTTCSSQEVSETQISNPVTAALNTHTSSLLTSDSIVRPGSHMLISIPNSQISPSGKLSYLVSPPLGSDIIAAHHSSTSDSTQSNTTASSVSRTIATISSEALNQLRNRILVPARHNVPNTASTLTSIPVTTIPSDSNRGRGPVTIIANQLISGVNPRVTTASTATTTRTYFSPTGGVYTITAPVTSQLSSKTADPAVQTLNQLVIPVMSKIHGTPNIQISSAAVTSTTPSQTCTLPARPNQGTYLITAGVGASASHAGITTTRSSRCVIPVIHNTRATTTSTTVVTNATTPLAQNADENAYTSSMAHRLMVQATMTESSPVTTIPGTTLTFTRTRAPQTVYSIPSAATHTKPSTTLCPATMALITFDPTVPRSASSSPSMVPSELTHSDLAMVSVTTATPTLANTGSNLVIKLATTCCTTTAASTVTAAVTTPITTAAVSPPDHNFLEPRQASRLRTFPGPRTYPVAQRTATGNILHRMSVRNATPQAANKKTIMTTSPLQIFADVVGPPKPIQSQITTTAQDQSKPRFTLSHSSGNSTLIVPQYKDTVFKNLATIAHPNPEPTGSRFLNTRMSSDRLVLNRSVAVVSPPRSVTVAQNESQRPQTTTSVVQPTLRQIQVTYVDRASTSIVTSTATAELTQNAPKLTATKKRNN